MNWGTWARAAAVVVLAVACSSTDDGAADADLTARVSAWCAQPGAQYVAVDARESLIGDMQVAERTELYCMPPADPAMTVSTLAAAECLELVRGLVNVTVEAIDTNDSTFFNMQLERIEVRYGQAWMLEGFHTRAVGVIGEAMRAGAAGLNQLGHADVIRLTEDGRAAGFRQAAYECQQAFR